MSLPSTDPVVHLLVVGHDEAGRAALVAALAAEACRAALRPALAVQGAAPGQALAAVRADAAVQLVLIDLH